MKRRKFISLLGGAVATGFSGSDYRPSNLVASGLLLVLLATPYAFESQRIDHRLSRGEYNDVFSKRRAIATAAPLDCVMTCS